MIVNESSVAELKLSLAPLGASSINEATEERTLSVPIFDFTDFGSEYERIIAKSASFADFMITGAGQSLIQPSSYWEDADSADPPLKCVNVETSLIKTTKLTFPTRADLVPSGSQGRLAFAEGGGLSVALKG